MKKRVLSGIRATGRLHLGNYLGAVKGMIALQNDPSYETFYMVADVHAITTPYNVEELRKNRREVIIDYLAAGLDPEKSVLFLQSDVPEHLELSFYFSSVVTIAKMQHLPTFKEKVKQYPEHATMALLNYPILMASDILIYKAGLVPVGIDQKPHLEVAREIARRMNQDYGTDFPEPQRFINRSLPAGRQGEYIPSLTGEGKMSKTIEGSYINLIDSLEVIRAKVAKIPTDSGKGVVRKTDEGYTYENENGQANGVAVLMTFVELFEGKERRHQLHKQYETSGVRYGEVKQELADAIFKQLEPIQKKRKELEKDSEYVNKIISEGAKKAAAVAQSTLHEVRQKMGLA